MIDSFFLPRHQNCFLVICAGTAPAEKTASALASRQSNLRHRHSGTELKERAGGGGRDGEEQILYQLHRPGDQSKHHLANQADHKADQSSEAESQADHNSADQQIIKANPKPIPTRTYNRSSPQLAAKR